jgi:integrase
MSKHWFSSAETQASKVTHQLEKNGDIKSVGTFRNYEQALKNVADYLKSEDLSSLNNLTPETATQYLVDRAVEVGQSQLDQERQAMQSLLHNFNHQLPSSQTLDVIKSEKESVLASRAYTPEQNKIIADHQNQKNGLATQIAYAAGLRAHELHTLQRIEERAPDARESHTAKFSGRDGQSYTVTGKGGLTREIRIPIELASKLETVRLSEPKQITDRGVHYTTNYAVAGGNAWSASFTRASQRSCGWSNGAHGVRHSYAQERMSELQRNHPYQDALRIVSQEMGHFRPEITEVYLR